MVRGFLVLGSGDKELLRVPVSGTVLVGRTEDCDLVVDDAAASRHHVEIAARNNRFFWKDLGSRNGTLVNGARMLEGELKSGDQIEIGQTTVRFEIEQAPDETDQEETAGMFRETISGGSESPGAPASGPAKTEQLLHAVYSVMNATATIYEPCTLVDRILETTVRAIHAQRGAIFFAGESDDDLLPCPVCGGVHVIRDGKLHRAGADEIRISSTVARQVLREGESVLFQNTENESLLNAAESIMSLKLRSILCVPLRAKNGILGILYIDTDRASHQYTREDMLLSTAVGNSAGLALENANMHLEMLEKQRIEQDIQHAWTIQEGFLVKEWPEGDPRFEVYGETHPAKTVGGDFYDFVQPDGDHVGILIGDVSGKGVPAALTMAQLLAAFRLYARSEASPTQVIKSLNADLVSRTRQGMFCTLCYLTLDLTNGNVLCANAGHHPALHVGPENPCSFGGASGPPAGILETAPWIDTEWSIGPGDTILLYTDGIVEGRCGKTAPDAKDAPEAPGEYGEERLFRAAQRLRGESPRTLVDAVSRDVEEFCAPLSPHDDRTMIALRYLGG